MGKALARNTGLFFEEFVSGDAITSVGRTVTETDIVNFAALSGDWNLIHTDAEYSRQSLFGERVAHGLLVLSIASGLAVRLGFMEDGVRQDRRHRAIARHHRRQKSHAAPGRRLRHLQDAGAQPT